MAITKDKVLLRIKHLLVANNDLVLHYASKYIDLGAVDLESYEDDYRLPGILVCAALKDASFQFEPPLPADKATVRNLSNF